MGGKGGRAFHSDLFVRFQSSGDLLHMLLGVHKRGLWLCFNTHADIYLKRLSQSEHKCHISSQDTLRSECSSAAECEKYCCISKYTAPLFFVTFVLAAQFVLVNVVIAVLMKHLKESKEKIAANVAAKDLEKKLKLLTLAAKNFIKGKAKRNEMPISRRRSVVQLGLGGIELAQLKRCEPDKPLDQSFCVEFARADAIFQEFLRLNANLQKVKMTIVRTSSHNTAIQATPTFATPAPCQRRNTVSGIRELHKKSSDLNKFTVYKSGA